MKEKEQSGTALADVNLSNRFLFAQVMQDPEIVRDVLRLILRDDRISKVALVETEKTVENICAGRGVRLDVYLKDEETAVYCVEMQCRNVDCIPRRSRYYQGSIDIDFLKRGDVFGELPDSYVIFICTFDLFHEGRCIYTFYNRCEESPDLYLGDGTAKIFVNCSAEDSTAPEELKALLRYIVCSTGATAEASGSELVKRLHRRVSEIKEDDDMSMAYTIWKTQRMDDLLEGVEIGKANGEERFSVLTRCLLADKRIDDLEKAAIDRDFRKKLFCEYGIE